MDQETAQRLFAKAYTAAEQKQFVLRLRREFVQEQHARDGLNADVSGFRAWLIGMLSEAATDTLLNRFPLEAAGGVTWLISYQSGHCENCGRASERLREIPTQTGEAIWHCERCHGAQGQVLERLAQEAQIERLRRTGP